MNNDETHVYNELLDKIISIYGGYANEYRGTTQPYNYEKFKKYLSNDKYDPKNIIYRESLLEHVGSLPVIASTIYPYINDAEVDLGRALLMLSIHDIGELATGDEITFIKKKESIKDEHAEALKLLDPYYHDLYFEVEERKSKSAQFAKSIDKIAPDIVDLITPVELTVVRYKEMVKKEPKEIMPMIREFKHPYMKWNKFIKEFHLVLLDRLEEQLKPYY